MKENGWDMIKVHCRQSVAEVTIDREEKLNALNTQVLTELYDVFEEIGQDGEIKAVILSGAGNAAFAAGADLAEIEATDYIERLEQYYARFNRVYEKIAVLPQPVIARVSGYAWGGGCLLALSCDLIVAEKNASFSQPEVNFGFTGGAAVLPRLVGRHVAAEIAFLGRPFSAEEAFRWNLVNRVADGEEELSRAACELARELVKKNPLTLSMIKRCIHNTYEVGMSAANRFETAASAICLSTEESRKQISRFLQRTK